MNVRRMVVLSGLALFAASAGSAFAQGDEIQLDPKLRAKIQAEWKTKAGKEKDGMVTKQQFMQPMEGHWHTFEKRHGHAGKVKPEDMPRLMMMLDGRDTSPP